MLTPLIWLWRHTFSIFYSVAFVFYPIHIGLSRLMYATNFYNCNAGQVVFTLFSCIHIYDLQHILIYYWVIQYNTVFRQAFLLIQYSFFGKQYFFLFRQRVSIFFWQMVNKTADCFNNILFWSWKLVEKIYWKNGKQLNVGKDLTSV